MSFGTVRHQPGPAVRVLRPGCRPRCYAALGLAVGLLAGMSTLTGTTAATPVYPVYPVAGTIDLSASPSAVAVDPSMHRVYVLTESGSELAVLVIDDSGGAQKAKEIASIDVGYFSYAGQVAVDPSTHDVFVAYSPLGATEGRLVVIDESGDAGNGTVTASIPVGDYSSGVAVDQSTHDVYVAEEGYPTGSVAVIDESGDADSAEVTATIPMAADPTAVAVDSRTHNVYVSSGNDGQPFTVVVIDESGDARRGHVTATIPVAAGPTGLAVDPTTHNVFVADSPYLAVSVIDGSGDARGGTVTATIPIDGLVRSVAVDPTTDDLYVTYEEGQDEMVAVVDESGGVGNGAVIATIPAGHATDTSDPIAVDPTTHLAYAANYWAERLAVVGPLTPSADVAMTITVPLHASDQSNLSETAVVTNHGPSTAEAVDTDLVVPAQLRVDSAPGASLQTGSLVWTDASLAPGASLTRTVTLTVGADVHTTIGIGGVTESASDDPDLSNNTAIAVVHLG